jgi:hypothetical protein
VTAARVLFDEAFVWLMRNASIAKIPASCRWRIRMCWGKVVFDKETAAGTAGRKQT